MAKFTAEDAIVLADVIVGKRPKLQAACVLREKLNDLIRQAEDDVNASKADTETKQTTSDAATQEGATCEHCAHHHHPAMNPRTWSTLPKELLQLVSARLPLYNVCTHFQQRQSTPHHAQHALGTMLPNMVQLAMIYESATRLWSCRNLFSDLVYGNWQHYPHLLHLGKI